MEWSPGRGVHKISIIKQSSRKELFESIKNQTKLTMGLLQSLSLAPYIRDHKKAFVLFLVLLFVMGGAWVGVGLTDEVDSDSLGTVLVFLQLALWLFLFVPLMLFK